MLHARGYAAHEAGGALLPFEFDRRDPGPKDVVVELLYCGICHSDLHMVDNDFGLGLYPMVPGHEMVGRVTHVGDAVTRLRPGDLAGIGCFTASCRTCEACTDGLEQYCEAYPTASFSTYERDGSLLLQGGFSSHYVVDEHFALKIPASLDPAAAAPLLCGGITTYSALRHARVGAGHRVGVVGLGGLGHLALKFARAMGAEVICFTTTAEKAADAVRLGAHDVVISSDPKDMARHLGSLHLVLDSVSAVHPLDDYLHLLRRDGVLCLLGMPGQPMSFTSMIMGARRRSILGSGVGGIPETQEMLDFCAEHRIAADIEILPVDRVNEALERLKRNDVRYRFVLDLAPLRS